MPSSRSRLAPDTIPPYKGREFEALKIRYEDQVALHRFATSFDWQVFTGYITIQLLLGSWLGLHPANGPILKLGFTVLDAVLAAVSAWLLWGNSERRKEIIATIKNLNEALGFNEKGLYLRDASINVPSEFHSSLIPYITGVLLAVLGVGLIIWF